MSNSKRSVTRPDDEDIINVDEDSNGTNSNDTEVNVLVGNDTDSNNQVSNNQASYSKASYDSDLCMENNKKYGFYSSLNDFKPVVNLGMTKGVDLSKIRLGDSRVRHFDPVTKRPIPIVSVTSAPLTVLDLMISTEKSDNVLTLRWSLTKCIDIFWIDGFRIMIHHGIEPNPSLIPVWRNVGYVSSNKNIKKYEVDISGFRKGISYVLSITAVHNSVDGPSAFIPINPF